jgi:hypothetical protein
VDRGGKDLSDQDPSYCKTFSNKCLVEKHLIAAASEPQARAEGHRASDYTILRPKCFADNALSPLLLFLWTRTMDNGMKQWPGFPFVIFGYEDPTMNGNLDNGDF